MTEPIKAPSTFEIVRDEDVTGVSGTGVVADGVIWPDGTATIRWRGDDPSTVNWDHGWRSIRKVHGHGGKTRFIEHDHQNLLARIAAAHDKHVTPSGATSGTCNECTWAWPCPTYLWATGQRNADATWIPGDEELEGM